MAHRYLIGAALSKEICTLSGVDYSEDILASMDCLRALGAKITVDGVRVTVDSGSFKASNYDMLYVYGARYDIVYRFEDLFDDGGISDQVVNTMGRCMWNRYMAIPHRNRQAHDP